ncbi:ATP-dependent DNA helicase [Butyrivibrio sp. YAB3001]|uniref:ATP-dependent DNA helicase n=1 Tax=Butyrivibrio sp. YAB3001 TaxID=1520812 RepID=UPI0008F62A5A|nr:ATP-dependent DNA helicase [Butyrivibrio sp. YAB3001]SFC61159.1 Rad3-related DNA helicase [Butyrivibrio sp. YAB3001]
MTINISVRGLVEFILRSGDIDNRIQQAPTDAMQEGGRIHRKIQKSMGADYHAEVPLKYIHVTPDYELVIEGRADGILDKYIDDPNAYDAQESFISASKPAPMIDEIKGTYRDLFKMKNPVEVHLAQAKCYAAMYSFMKHCPNINVRMSYCNLDTEDMKYFDFSFSYEEITSWFKELVFQYLKWSDFEYHWTGLRTSSIKSVQFPFPYREGQKDLAAAVYRTIIHGKKLFLEAPTGTGKTITTIFPTVKAIGEGKSSKLFYLTAKSITRTVAEEAFETLRNNQGLRFKTATITARDKICFLDETKRNCNPEACPYAKGHFDRVNDAIFELMNSEDSFSREKIVEFAQKHQVCPFELSLDMSLFADGIICDYNYVFDPFVYLRRFFAEGKKTDYVFLVDETHNLLDRGRDMYSSFLRKESFLELKNDIKEFHPSIAGHLEKCNKVLLEMKRECDGCTVLNSIEKLINPLNTLAGIISEYLENHSEGPCRDEILQFYFDVSRFLTIYDLVDDHYVMYSEFAEDGSFLVRLACADPSRNLALCMARGRSSILFSATLLPVQYYKKLLGGTDEDFEIYAKSVFDPARLGLFIGTDVTSKYSMRSTQQYDSIASYIANMIEAKAGNYLIFFPSHQFLESVQEIFVDKYYDPENTELLIQGDYMSEEAREAFLERFSTGNNLDLSSIINMDIEIVDNKNLVGFCVMGGIFSEGIDLKNDSLIGVIVVGTGIPMVCNEREILREYFEKRGYDGFDYAYRFPGMNKVLQAAGRVIRTEEDKGVVTLLDNRFTQMSYKTLFPREWIGYKNVTTGTVKNAIIQFWSEV